MTKTIYAFKQLFDDFVIYYYPMGETIFQTGLPVDGFLYSPFIAILLAVFPPLGLSTSLVVWGILQAFAMILYLLLFRRLVPAGLAVQLLFVFLALSSYPLVLNFLGGQVSVFIIIAILGALVFSKRSHLIAGAGLLGLAVSFKFYPILFVAPFTARRDTRFLLLTFSACIAFLFIVPAILLGPGGTLHFYRALLGSFRDSAWVTANPHSHYFPHLVLRLSEAMGQDAHALLPLLRWIAYGAAAANLGFIFLVQRARLRYADLWSFQIVFMTIPFVLKTSWPHDFVFLPFTQAFMIWWILRGEREASGNNSIRNPSHASRNPRLRTALIFVFLLPSIVFCNIVFFNLFGDFTRFGFYGFLFWANLLLLIATYVQLLPPALQRIRKPQAG